jgi:hypothetical protein
LRPRGVEGVAGVENQLPNKKCNIHSTSILLPSKKCRSIASVDEQPSVILPLNKETLQRIKRILSLPYLSREEIGLKEDISFFVWQEEALLHRYTCYTLYTLFLVRSTG